jgi:hypothetical protein
LAQILADALVRDPSGIKLIDAAKCARDGSCATPLAYLEAFQRYDPAAGLTTVSQLPGYVRSLVMDCTIKGRFMMADIYLRSLTAMVRVETARMSRFIGNAECVFKNPKTGQPVIAQRCANPVGKRVAPPLLPPPPKHHCHTISFNARPDAWVSWYAASTTGPFRPDVCNAQKQDNGSWRAWYGQCDQCTPSVAFAKRVLGGAAEIVHQYFYRVTDERQTLSFDDSVTEKEIGICRVSEHRQVASRRVHIRPEDWKGRSHIDIPDSFWQLDDGQHPE